MTQTFSYPASWKLMEIERELIPRLTMERPIFQILPMMNVDAATLVWEQQDTIRGLQQVRGLGGAPRSVSTGGMIQKTGQPGYYGEFATIGEQQLTLMKKPGTLAEPIDLTSLVRTKQEWLLERRLSRIESIGWTLLATGTFSALGNEGQVLHTDSYTCQTYTAGVPWATIATATPLADFRAIKLLARGHSVYFGRQSRAYVNQTTFNSLISNVNQNDLGGKRTYGLASITGLDDVNRIFMGDDLPTLTIYDQGYFDDSGSFQLYIPNNKCIVIGVRQTGVPIGQTQFVRNVNNPDLAPGPYMKIVDNLDRDVPRELRIHDGFSGGPVLQFPAAIVQMTV